MEIKEQKHSIPNNIIYLLRPIAANKPRYLFNLAAEAVLFVLLPLMASGISSMVVGMLGQELTLPIIVLAIVSAFVVYGIVNWLHTYFNTYNNAVYIDMRISYHYQKLTRKVIETSLEQSESNVVRKALSKAFLAISNNKIGVEGMLRSLQVFVANILGLVVYVIIVGTLDWRIVSLLVVLSVITTLIAGLTTKVFNRIKDKIAEQERVEQYINRVVDDVDGGKDIRIMGLSDWLIHKYDQAIKEKRKILFSYDFVCFIADAVETILSAARDLICYVYLISLLKEGMPIAQFVFYLGLISGFAAWFTQISKMFIEIKKDSEQINDMRTFIELKNGMEDIGIVPEQGFEELNIVFEHVSYQYEGAKKAVLNDISFQMKQGKHLALVGLNGAGKSTLVKLMSGLYLPTSGNVYINGVNTRELNRVQYMKHIAAIFQDPFIMSYSLGENIALDETFDEARAMEALRIAGLLKKVNTLPKGLQTYLGKDIDESGIRFSGGETQKLLLARAIYRNPKLVLFDEPTAALDAIAENEIYETYSDVLRDKSALFISHRLASTRFCDEIILIENGLIEEVGTHDTLLSKNGKYADLFRVQAKYYNEAVN